MKNSPRTASLTALTCAVVLAALVGAVPVEAQSSDFQLFDRFNFRADASWVRLKTQVRLDSKSLGLGTTLNFEKDLDLGDQDTVPSLSFEWQVGRKHRLAARWQDVSRSSSAQALTEIRWGDEVIPIDASIALGFDITQFAVDYTYFPWVEERWAAGFGVGLRVLDINARLAWEGANLEVGGVEAADVTGPLPYLNFQYRRMFSEHWRFNTHLGWLSVKIGDIDGGQWLASASIEYLLGTTWAFGAALNYSAVDVDWEDADSLGHIDLDINDLSLFLRVRF